MIYGVSGMSVASRVYNTSQSFPTGESHNYRSVTMGDKSESDYSVIVAI